VGTKDNVLKKKDNCIGETGAGMISDSLKSNTSLTRLCLHGWGKDNIKVMR